MANTMVKERKASYMQLTKSAERQFADAEADAVRQAFLPTSYVQLRTLPARLQKMREKSRGNPSNAERRSKPWDISQNDAASPALIDGTSFDNEYDKGNIRTVTGTLTPRKFSVAPRCFSSFSYMPSEYELEKVKRAQDKHDHATKIIGPTSVKTGMPTIPDKQGTFTHFRYEVDPYESKDENWRDGKTRDNNMKRGFTPGGKHVAKNNLMQKKTSQHELVGRLVATLQADWPEAFERCFTDKRGLIICLFSDRGDQEASWRTELLGYMHQLVKTHPVSNEFVLRKMSARWGKKSNGYIEFALQPPWVQVSPYEPYFRSHLEDAAKLLVKKRTTPKDRTPTMASRRMAFPPQTPNGTRIYAYIPQEGHLN